jgi:hypothetical protein
VSQKSCERDELKGIVPLCPIGIKLTACFLPERGGVEETPSTDKEFLALYLLPLGLIRELGSQDG